MAWNQSVLIGNQVVIPKNAKFIFFWELFLFFFPPPLYLYSKLIFIKENRSLICLLACFVFHTIEYNWMLVRSICCLHRQFDWFVQLFSLVCLLFFCKCRMKWNKTDRDDKYYFSLSDMSVEIINMSMRSIHLSVCVCYCHAAFFLLFLKRMIRRFESNKFRFF